MAQERRVHNARPIPIYVGGRPVYHVTGPALTKTFRSNHILRRPPGLGVDIAVLNEAEQLGADRLIFTHRETDDVYVCGLQFFREFSVPVNRGYGEQAALPLSYWSVNGKDPERKPLAIVGAEKASERANAPAQMSLFARAS